MGDWLGQVEMILIVPCKRILRGRGLPGRKGTGEEGLTRK